MAASKRKKEVRRKANPGDKFIVQVGDPEKYYSENPAWTFSNSDQEMWTFTKEHLGNLFWTELLPKLKSLESQKWSDILIKGNKQNHSLDLTDLNKVAQDRLAEKLSKLSL